MNCLGKDAPTDNFGARTDPVLVELQSVSLKLKHSAVRAEAMQDQLKQLTSAVTGISAGLLNSSKSLSLEETDTLVQKISQTLLAQRRIDEITASKESSAQAISAQSQMAKECLSRDQLNESLVMFRDGLVLDIQKDLTNRFEQIGQAVSKLDNLVSTIYAGDQAAVTVAAQDNSLSRPDATNLQSGCPHLELSRSETDLGAEQDAHLEALPLSGKEPQQRRPSASSPPQLLPKVGTNEDVNVVESALECHVADPLRVSARPTSARVGDRKETETEDINKVSSASSARNSNSQAGAVVPVKGARDSQNGAGIGGIRNKFKAKNLDEEEYDVSMFYYSSGVMQAIARSDLFGRLCLAIIALNALYMGIDSDYNDAVSINEAQLPFQACALFFFVFFTLELFIRFAAFEVKRNCFTDAWFKFDSLIVAILWTDGCIVPLIAVLADLDQSQLNIGPLKLLRLLRLLRLSRILRAFPELMVMLQGMFVATRAVGSAMMLLVISVYGWGIAMHALLKNEESLKEYWGTVGRCMLTLLGNGTLCDNITQIMRDLAWSNPPAFIAFVAFVLFSSFTVLNMLIGVLCEVVGAVAEAERQAVALSKLKGKLLVMLKSIDADGSGDISQDELCSIIEHEECADVIRSLKIDLPEMIDVFEMFFQRHGAMQIRDIMQILLDNQGDRGATVQDLCTSSKLSRFMLRKDLKLMREELTTTHNLIREHLGLAVEDTAAPRVSLLGQGRMKWIEADEGNYANVIDASLVQIRDLKHKSV